jgi:hypothetical protein
MAKCPVKEPMAVPDLANGKAHLGEGGIQVRELSRLELLDLDRPIYGLIWFLMICW